MKRFKQSRGFNQRRGVPLGAPAGEPPPASLVHAALNASGTSTGSPLQKKKFGMTTNNQKGGSK